VARQLGDAEIKGECALVLSCPVSRGGTAPDLDLKGALLAVWRESGLSGRRLADRVAETLQLPRRRVYQAYLALKEEGGIG
jgi:hypothetical protein